LAAKLSGFGKIGIAKKPTLSLAEELAIPRPLPLPLVLRSHQHVAVAMAVGQSGEKFQNNLIENKRRFLY
jgi:hypothetical protein